MDITEQQTTILRYICIAVILIFAANLIALLHNLYRYIYKQKIYAPLILLFYLFVFLSFVFRIVELSTVVVWTQFFPMSNPADALAAVASSCLIYAGLTLILSMHQLSITIKAITLRIQSD